MKTQMDHEEADAYGSKKYIHEESDGTRASEPESTFVALQLRMAGKKWNILSTQFVCYICSVKLASFPHLHLRQLVCHLFYRMIRTPSRRSPNSND